MAGVFMPKSGARRRRKHKKTSPNNVVIRRLPVKRLDLIKIRAQPVGLCTWYSVVVFAKRRLSHCVGPSRGAMHPAKGQLSVNECRRFANTTTEY